MNTCIAKRLTQPVSLFSTQSFTSFRCLGTLTHPHLPWPAHRPRPSPFATHLHLHHTHLASAFAARPLSDTASSCWKLARSTCCCSMASDSCCCSRLTSCWLCSRWTCWCVLVYHSLTVHTMLPCEHVIVCLMACCGVVCTRPPGKQPPLGGKQTC